MAYTTKLFILFLAMVTVLLGYNYLKKPFANLTTSTTQTQPSPTPTTSSLSETDQIFNLLSTREKVAQVLMTPVTLSSSPSAQVRESLTWAIAEQPGFVIVFGNRIATQSAQQLATEIESATRAKPLEIVIAVDHEGGTVQRYSGQGFTALPSWQAVCALEKKEERVALLASSAAQLKAVGVGMVLAPVFDTKVAGSPLGSRTCSVDQAIISERSKEFIDAFAANDILPVVKHFPNIGFARLDLHTNFDTVSLKGDDLLGLRNLLTQYPKIGVMVSHIGVSNQDAIRPCSMSPDCIKELTSNFPETLVISDALDMRSAQGKIASGSAVLTTEELVIKSLVSGNDIALVGKDAQPEMLDAILNQLEKKYQSEESFKTIIDQKVKKIITVKRGLQTGQL